MSLISANIRISTTWPKPHLYALTTLIISTSFTNTIVTLLSDN
jgi:hypothetical protein